MQSDYKLSIIIPHYNSPNLLKKLLSTIPNKKCIQTIVIDDGSSEEAKKELQNIKESYDGREILFLENDTEEHNAGVSRNIGLKHSTGEWILFADADDYFLNGFYEIIEKYFETNYDIVFFSFNSIEIDTENQSDRHITYNNYINSFIKNPNLMTAANLRYRWYSPWCKLIKKSLIDLNKISFDSVPVSNDVMFSAKVGLFAKKITASKEEIYCVTRRKGSLTTKYDLKTYDVRVKVMINYFQFLKLHITPEEFHEIETYHIAWKWLHVIVQRKYGIKVFWKYLKIFRKNKMLLFDVRIFTHLNFIRWLRNRRRENEFRARYEE